MNGAPRPWELDAPILGRPRHIHQIALPQELLDTCLGRLEPHARRGAHVARYLTVPLLSLADVGSYALAQAGYPARSEALTWLGLLHDGRVLPVPPRNELLALASQRRLLDAESPVALTEAGWARLGLPAPPPPHVAGAPLVFVPADRLGDRLGQAIGDPIGSGPAAGQPATAYRRPRGRVVPPAAGSQGISGGDGAKECTPQPPSAGETAGGGGDSILSSPRPDSPSGSIAATAAHEDTLTAARLRRLGVRRDVAATLADRPLAQVERVIAQARARQDVRDQAAWVVAALRALPADAAPQPAPPPKVSDLAILTHPGLTNHERVRWLTRFRNADPAERPDVLSRFHQEHPNDVG